MATFPTISSGQVAKYPAVRRRVRRTVVHTFVDMSEQRYALGDDLAQFDLTFNNVTTVDKDVLKTFFNARKGALDATWTYPFEDPPGTITNYDNMQFVPQQSFIATNVGPGRWSVTLRIRQTNPLT